MPSDNHLALLLRFCGSEDDAPREWELWQERTGLVRPPWAAGAVPADYGMTEDELKAARAMVREYLPLKGDARVDFLRGKKATQMEGRKVLTKWLEGVWERQWKIRTVAEAEAEALELPVQRLMQKGGGVSKVYRY